MGALHHVGAGIFGRHRKGRDTEATRPTQVSSTGKSFDLVRTFALLSLFSIVLIGIVSGVVLTRFLVENMIKRDAAVTMQFIHIIAEAETSEHLFSGDNLLYDRAGLQSFLIHFRYIPDVVRTNVYAPDHTMIWSSDPKLMGKSFGHNPELQRALAGELVYRLTAPSPTEKPEHRYFAESITEFVEIYIPLWNRDRNRIVGVAELYKVPDALFAAIRQTEQLVWIGGIVGGLFLYVALFGIVRHANSIMRRQEKELRKEITEHKHDKDTLIDSERKLRTLSSQMLMVQEQERKRIAAELHDGIGQSLSAIKFGAESALKTISADAPGANLEKLDTIVKKIKDAIEEAQRIAMDLRPAMLDDLGIVATIDWFCREFQSIYPHIEVTKRIELDEDAIGITLKTVLYRITQEALNNVAKHAEADHAEIDLQATEEHIRLRIRDNGYGFDPDSGTKATNGRRGLGLPGMRERVELSGGHFSLESNPGKGTLIEASWPRVA
jgi:signal transduction histidine kinase